MSANDAHYSASTLIAEIADLRERNRALREALKAIVQEYEAWGASRRPAEFAREALENSARIAREALEKNPL